MRSSLVAFALILQAGCPSGVATYQVARGAAGKFPAGKTGCAPVSSRSASIVQIEDGRFYRAIDIGKADIQCTGDRLILDVRQVARIQLVHRTSTADRGYDVITLEAFDDGGAQLSLGDHPNVDWDVPDTLERRSGCHGHIIPSCDPSYVVGVRAMNPGDHSVTVRFAGHQKSIDIDYLDR